MSEHVERNPCEVKCCTPHVHFCNIGDEQDDDCAEKNCGNKKCTGWRNYSRLKRLYAHDSISRDETLKSSINIAEEIRIKVAFLRDWDTDFPSSVFADVLSEILEGRA